MKNLTLAQGARMAKQFGIGAVDALGVLEMAVDPCAVNPQQFSFCGQQIY
jgi:hypothetical protein